MCRIAGIWKPNAEAGELQQVMSLMTRAMRRGGPDDEGFYINAARGLALGHRRLSLIDLSAAGHQPMADKGGALQLIFNGEIYNFLELKTELEGLGHVFNTHSDTEVILKAYSQWGLDCFSRFNGMFALALYDQGEETLTLARDHAGIKPLYYGWHQNSLYFGSELRGFKSLPIAWAENPNWKTFFLAMGFVPEPYTTLANIQSLPAGSYLQVQLPSGKTVLTAFQAFHTRPEIFSEAEAIAHLRELLPRAVERHLISDAPIGLFLSGGIDSSLLTLLAQPVLGNQLHTLSIVFNEENFSEKKYQDIIIRQTGAQHQSFLVSESDFDEALPDALEAMDMPSIDGINSYFISKYAHAYGLKAVLSGLGADELFGGYPSFRRSRQYRQAGMLPATVLGLFRHLPADRWKKMSYAAWKSPMGEYLVYRGIHHPAGIAKILDAQEAEVVKTLQSLPLPEELAQMEPGNRVSWLETNLYMKGQLLRDTDYMSMWHGLEVRVPFLDKSLMEAAWKIAPEIKFNHPVGKYLLIEAFRSLLPEAIWNRKKQGFTFPFSGWMKKVDFVKPQTRAEEDWFADYVKGRLTWGRYWAAILASR